MVAMAVAQAGLTWRGSYRAGPVASALGDHVIPPADR